MGSNTKAKTQEQPLIGPWQTAIGTPQMIAAFNEMDKTLASIDGRLEAVNERLGRIDVRLESMDSRLQSIQEGQHDGFTTTTGLLREILDKLPDKETAVAKSEDWVQHYAASRDYDALFDRLKPVVEKDVAAANETVADQFSITHYPQHGGNFAVVRTVWGRERWTAFDKESDHLVVRFGQQSRAPSDFTVKLVWNDADERMDVTLESGEETESFSADELWRISQRALRWMLA